MDKRRGDSGEGAESPRLLSTRYSLRHSSLTERLEQAKLTVLASKRDRYNSYALYSLSFEATLKGPIGYYVPGGWGVEGEGGGGGGGGD